MARIGIIGTGWGARVQTPAFREAGLEVVAIAGRDAAKTKEVARELDLQAFADWRDLVASDVDLVTIVTPPSEHLEMATAALEHGKHVLCEKPTAPHAPPPLAASLHQFQARFRSPRPGLAYRTSAYQIAPSSCSCSRAAAKEGRKRNS